MLKKSQHITCMQWFLKATREFSGGIWGHRKENLLSLQRRSVGCFVDRAKKKQQNRMLVSCLSTKHHLFRQNKNWFGVCEKTKANTVWDMRKWFCQHAWNLILEGTISVSMPKAMRIFKATSYSATWYSMGWFQFGSTWGLSGSRPYIFYSFEEA